jgi:SAM-dependent methyltransferase
MEYGPKEDLVSFESSRLGTLEYWQAFYERELENVKGNPGDIGGVWFGSQVEGRILGYIYRNYSIATRVIDIGCGNGNFLLQLAAKGFTDLHGFDYSSYSVEFAKINSAGVNINLFQSDIRHPKHCVAGAELFCDKGTFDALCLARGTDGRPENVLQAYCQLFNTMGARECTFILTSCNWTRRELEHYFLSLNFIVVDEIGHPAFSFGGKTGQTVTTLVFKFIK